MLQYCNTKLQLTVFIVVFTLIVIFSLTYRADFLTVQLRNVSLISPSPNKIFCFILSQPKNEKKRRAVNDTWAQLCDGYVFVLGNETIKNYPVINVPVKESRETLMIKSNFMIIYLHKFYGHQYDFFMKADDDTFVVVRNLRYFLQDKNPAEKIIAGRRFKPYVKQGYLSGGAGYVISRSGLHALANQLERTDTKCPKSGPEDVGIGKCAELAGVKIVSSVDANGLERFHPLDPLAMLSGSSAAPWLKDYNWEPLRTGFRCCSRRSISFHYVKPELMYTLHVVSNNVDY